METIKLIENADTEEIPPQIISEANFPCTDLHGITLQETRILNSTSVRISVVAFVLHGRVV
jgi:hypothetical protein